MEGKLNYKLSQLNAGLKDFRDSLAIDLPALPANIADAVKSGQV